MKYFQICMNEKYLLLKKNKLILEHIILKNWPEDNSTYNYNS